jgi:UDP-N-acetylmuramate--alanine ligase
MMHTSIPLEIGILHFVGIGGIGMSGIAEILHNLGYKVQGSDVSESSNVARLRKLGIAVFIGHKPENLENAHVLVVSSAIKPDNPELIAARNQRLPVVKRAEMLAELVRLKWSIAIAGTHGKTTTTTLIAQILETAKLDPTVINGGIINAYGTNTRLGAGDWMVVEADESDGTFLKLGATIAVVTNIDPEHLDHYGDFETLKAAFVSFIQNLPFYGYGVVCIDHPDVQALIPKIADRRLITYGFSPQADVRAVNLRKTNTGTLFDVDLQGRTLPDLFLPMLGEHNVQNALSAVAIAQQLKIEDSTLKQGLANFAGVKRRFTLVDVVDGVTIIDDYGHHPVEIAAVLKAARDATDKKVIAVVEPHRYTRVRDLWEQFSTCFNLADTVVLLPIYEAGETPLDGITSNALGESIRNHGHKNVTVLESADALATLVKNTTATGDYVVCLGAGNITQIAHALPQQLKDL